MALNITVEPSDRAVLEGWLRSPSIRAGLAKRARIVLLAADGIGTNGIVERLGVSKQSHLVEEAVRGRGCFRFGGPPETGAAPADR